MNRQGKTSFVLATVMAMTLAVPGGVRADGGHYGYGRYPGRPPYHAPYYPRYYPNYYQHYYPNYYPCNNCSNNDHHDNHNNYKLWLGILGGGIAGYALSNIYQGGTTNPGYYSPANAAPPPPTVTQYARPAPINSCLQEREYRTKIMVGDKQVDGYGTACLQPDGSWRYGTAQAGSY